MPLHVHSSVHTPSLKGKWTVLFSFVPNPDNAYEVEQLCEKKDDFEKRSCEVLAITTHWDDARPPVWFKVVEDKDSKLLESLKMNPNGSPRGMKLRATITPDGVLHGHSVDRVLYIVDPTSHVRYVRVLPQHSRREFDEVLQVLDSLQQEDQNHASSNHSSWRMSLSPVLSALKKTRQHAAASLS